MMNNYDEPLLMPMEQGLRAMTASEQREYYRSWNQANKKEDDNEDPEMPEVQEFTEPPFAVRCDGQKTFRKLPVEVEGMKWTGLNIHVMHQFVGKKDQTEDSSGEWRFLTPVEISGVMESSAIVWDDVQRGWIPVHIGDTILRGVSGEYYPISEDVLNKTYEEVN